MITRFKRFMKRINRNFCHSSKCGMTFIEVLISIVIVSIVSIAFYATAVFTMKQSISALERTYAMQASKSLATRLRSSKLTNLIKNPASMDNPSFERTNFSNLTGTINFDTQSSRQNPITYKIDLVGFGNFVTETGVTVNKYKLLLPARSADWKENQFAGSMVTIIGGAGQNQIGRIVSHKASTAQGQNKLVTDVVITSDVSLTGTNLTAVWKERPDDSSMFLINYGITANIKTTWDDGKKTMEQTVYVPY